VKLKLKKVKVHNLKTVDLDLENQEFIVFTGVSGSGKSSLAFDTIYAEGQRRYIESLSHQQRRHLKELSKPDAEMIEGVSPSIAIEQKRSSKTPRSTVGTMTGIYDHLRVLFARVATPYCPDSGEPLQNQSREKIIESVLRLQDKKLFLLAPYLKSKKGELKEELKDLLRRGYIRLRIDGEIVDNEEGLLLDKNNSHSVDLVIDRVIIGSTSDESVISSITNCLELGKGYFSVLDKETEEETTFSEFAFSKKSNISYGPLEPVDFSFNHPLGMCPECKGLGNSQKFDLDKIIDENKSISEDCCRIASSYQTIYYKNVFDNLAEEYDFSVDTPWKDLPEKGKKVFLYGINKKYMRMRFKHPKKKKSWVDYVAWKGVLHGAYERLEKATSDSYKRKYEEMMTLGICEKCKGSRIKAYPAAAKLSGKTISSLCGMTIEETSNFLKKITLSKVEKKIAEDLLKEINKRLDFLLNVGLEYLTLDRTAPSLSGGESQRVRLASQIGSGLVGTTYVLDEPSIGLHAQDHKLLIKTLTRLQALGNTIICVEHDPCMMQAADTIVDVGPYAGKKGGEIVFKGSYKEILEDKNSLTGAYLSKRKTITYPKKRRKLTRSLTVHGACENNLQNIDVDIPLEGLVTITGVSGSGKSSLIIDTLYPALSNIFSTSKLKVGKHKNITGTDKLDKVIAIDQSPIGKTSRSNLATYVKLLDDIRVFFSGLPESKIRGYIPGHFSFNVKEGSCPYCKGLGLVTIDMDFLEDRQVVCKQCKGKRYDPEILAIHFKDKNIDDVLKMDVEEALNFFENIPHIKRKLFFLSKIGLGYIPLGQSSTTLSGGEAQRIKLAKQLIRPSTHKTLYILDEPSTGLHFHDLEKLIGLVQELVDQKNSVIIIEHNLDIIRSSDWAIDLGPKSGKNGGKVLFTGTPEDLIKQKSPTGLALKEYLEEKTTTKTFVKEKTNVPPLIIEKASQNNLKNISLTLPKNKMIAFCGPSGSGKSSLAFDTIFSEGQRRYIETLPPYMRQFIEMMPKAKVEKISGLNPSIAIEQKAKGHNPRSTVGTLTEIYDLFRILYAHIGVAFCPQSGERIEEISKEYVVNKILNSYLGERIHILSPLKIYPHEVFSEKLNSLVQKGYLRIRLNGTYYEMDEEIPYEKHKKNEIYLVIDRLKINKDAEKRLFESIEIASSLSDKTFLLALENEDLFYNLSFSVEKTGKSYPPITPQTFSFNSEEGMCLECQGLGTVYGVDFSKIENFERKSILQICRLLFTRGTDFLDLVYDLFEAEYIDVNLPFKKLTKEEKHFFLHGSDKSIKIKKNLYATWRGVDTTLAKAAKSIKGPPRFFMRNLMKDKTCPTCQGSRLNPLATNVKVQGSTIVDLCSFPIEKTFAFFNSLKKPPKYLQETLDQIHKNLSFLLSIGLHYLSLDRKTPTLSGGELQRIKLAQQLGSSLHSCLYILDEPTIGLHPFNTDLLIKALLKLKTHNNTLIIVEHDQSVLKKADYIVDFGPKAGIAGGKITAQGTYKQILSSKDSLTGAYLNKTKTIPLPKTRRKSKESLSIKNATTHNLKNLSLDIPLNTLTCLCGVSGSGKSTLVFDILKPACKESRFREDLATVNNATISGLKQCKQLILIDQSPISQNIRSDVNTYSEIAPLLRSHYASLAFSKAHGLFPRYFSYNHKKGMCKECMGIGYHVIDLQFLPSVKVTCDACKGYRLNPMTLSAKYKEKHFGQLLDLTVEEAAIFLEPLYKIHKKLQMLIDVGLGYIKLNQDIASLSGGEAQRLKLSKELSKSHTKDTLYLIDEPTIGLHPDDIAKLIPLFHRLVDQKNTLVVIEHNEKVLAQADYLFELGPEGGEKGGEILSKGTPEEVFKNKKSIIKNYLFN
jgi:excinuclease ABC subunit A